MNLNVKSMIQQAGCVKVHTMFLKFAIAPKKCIILDKLHQFGAFLCFEMHAIGS